MVLSKCRSNEIDKYVIYNYQQQIWYFGSLQRTAWLDRGVNELPTAASPDYYLYNHETGDDDGSTDPVTAITAHIESSQMDIGEGDQFTFISRIIPDITFRNSEIGKKASLSLKAELSGETICKLILLRYPKQQQCLLNNLQMMRL